MTGTPRVGVAGYGHWGRNLVRNFATLGALAAASDPDPGAREALARDHPEVARHDSFDALLAHPGLDAVVIASPAATHGALALRALEAGLNVFVEKPMALDLGEAERIESLAASRGLVLMVGHLLLYHPAYDALRRVIAAGELGELRYVYSHRLSLGRIRREENALWSFAPHDISMILGLVGEQPSRIVANGGTYLSPDVADTTLTHLTFPGAVQAHIFVSWLHPYKDHRMVVVGSEGMIVFDDVERGADKLLLYPHKVGWSQGLPSVDRAEAVPIAYEPTEPLACECRHFLDCVASGSRPLSDATEGRRVLAVLDACQRSLRSGAPIDLENTGVPQ